MKSGKIRVNTWKVLRYVTVIGQATHFQIGAISNPALTPCTLHKNWRERRWRDPSYQSKTIRGNKYYKR